MNDILSNVPSGRRVLIVRINAGKGIVSRLYQMGLLPGEEVLVKHNNRGMVVLEVRGVEIGVSRGIAMKIEVRST